MPGDDDDDTTTTAKKPSMWRRIWNWLIGK